MHLQGKFLLHGAVSKAVIFLEGPPPGIDILIDSLVLKRATKIPRPPLLNFEVSRSSYSPYYFQNLCLYTLLSPCLAFVDRGRYLNIILLENLAFHHVVHI